jgi:purine-nucleoside phosphorylase
MTLAPEEADRVTSPVDPIACAAAYVQQGRPEPPDVGVVLGSGLGAWASQLEQAESLPYTSVPYMPSPSVAGHSGRLWLGRRGPVRVACLEGRVHAYEGHRVERVVFGVRLLAALGCRCVLLTNAAGGIRADLTPGSLLLITDHLNLSGRNPLVGWAPQGGHPPFIDLTRAYDAELAEAARAGARALGQPLAEGVYAGLLGPSYETPAEIRMLRTLGADAVGMSTVLEAIALRERGVRVGAVSCITNLAAGLSSTTLNHAEVQATAAEAKSRFSALLDAWVLRAAALR